MKPYMVYVPYQCWTKNNGKGRLKHGALYSSEFPLAIVNREEAKKPRKGEIKPVKKKKTRTKSFYLISFQASMTSSVCELLLGFSNIIRITPSASIRKVVR